MATTKQLIEGALRSLGVLASGEEAKPSEVQDALVIAQDMLDSWANESLLIPAYVHESFTLTGGREYTIGEGGDFDTVRPTGISHVRVRDAGGLESPVELAPLNLWAELPLKDNVVSFPAYVNYNPDYPLGVLRFSEIPETGNTLKLVSIKPLADLPALTADLEFPKGYNRAIRLGLHIELAPEYGKDVSNVVAAQFRHALTVLKRTNSKGRSGALKVDAGLVRKGGYDITHGPT